MREILFKAKRVDNREWAEGDLIMGTNESFINTSDNGYWTKYSTKSDESLHKVIEMYHAAEVIPSTVCQFTGLTDKNGVKIFEGDIIQFDQNEERYEARYWSNYIVRIPNIFYTIDHEFNDDTIEKIPVLVIGSIHDEVKP